MSGEASHVEVVAAQMAMLGVDREELIAFLEQEGQDGGVTFGEFIDGKVIPSLLKGQRTVWATYAKLATDGLPGLCSCFCESCLAHFKANSSWTPCPCVTSKSCGCSAAKLSFGEVASSSCLEQARVLRDVAFRHVTLADLETLARWAQMRAQKRLEVRNQARGKEGRPTHAHEGRSAVEHLRAFMSATYRLAIAQRLPGTRANLGLEMARKARPEPKSRGYSEEQIHEMWSAVFTSGGDDPELDMLLLWFPLETGSRRGGPVMLTIGDLGFHTMKVRLGEKDGKVSEQPISEELLAVMLGHALRRGDILLKNPHGLAIDEITIDDVKQRRVTLRTDAAVFYYQHPKKMVGPEGAVIEVPRPLTAKRYETLYRRLRKTLPWLDAIHGRPHDLRKTMGTFIERAFGHAIAQGWLRHAVHDTTGTYTKASVEAIEGAHAWLVGEGS